MAAFRTETTFFFFPKQPILNEEVNCADPSLRYGFPEPIFSKQVWQTPEIHEQVAILLLRDF
jgi:hypothetical protein